LADCELLQTCIFFNDKMANMPSTASLFKQDYCQNNFEACARYKVAKALGRLKVPADLFPNQQHRAQDIISLG
jgi:hypothetical protein